MGYDTSYFCVIEMSLSIPSHLFFKILIFVLPCSFFFLGSISIIDCVCFWGKSAAIPEPKS